MAVASDCTEDGILLAYYTVCCTFDVVLGASCVVLGFAGSVLFATGLLPSGSPRYVTNRLNDGALDGVVLTGGLATETSAQLGTEVGIINTPGLRWLRVVRRGVGRHGCCDVVSCGVELWCLCGVMGWVSVAHLPVFI